MEIRNSQVIRLGTTRPYGPTGNTPLSEVRSEIREQLNRCLIHLELLKNGEGMLYKISMSVNGMGKLDVYQVIYFLALHIKKTFASA